MQEHFDPAECCHRQGRDHSSKVSFALPTMAVSIEVVRCRLGLSRLFSTRKTPREVVSGTKVLAYISNMTSCHSS